MQKKILSLSEITEIERTYKHGFPSLGFAAEELLHRWRNDLRDEETCVRLIFLRWYSCSEPSYLTGLENEMPTIETIINEFGGEVVLSSETLFILGILGHDTFAFCFGEESIWQKKCIGFLERATELQPSSQLFEDWNYFIGKSANTKNLKTKIIPEIHARFNGRGALGDYLKHILTFIVKSK
ncbi:MAG: hypothetical protein M3405_10595 [Acidobacteriota bacterium]|jgi:hypothetical protein|nr:hypothetical protein [Acidobacteriota bacterium]